MKLSIIIPVYNEHTTIMKVLQRVVSEDLSMLNLDREIIVVDDGSTDGTKEMLKEVDSQQSIVDGKNQVKIIYHERNAGKGAAIRAGFANATGDIVVIQDADLEYNPEDFKVLLRPILEGEANVVYGSRFLRKNPCIYFHYALGNKFLSFLVSMFFNGKVTDSYTCYKMMKKEIFDKIFLESNGFEIEAEITSKLLKAGYKIVEVPISYSPRSIEAGKKIGWRDAFLGIWTIIKNRSVL